jgi:hypothetical protein
MMNFKKRTALTIVSTAGAMTTAAFVMEFSAVALPDSIFQHVIPAIRRELPKGMVMRLPSHVPYVYKEERFYNGYGTKVYVSNSGYASDGDSGGRYFIALSRTPNCNVTACGVGIISAQRNKPIITDSNTGVESTSKEKRIMIKPGLSGYYFYARAGSAGERHHIYWQQNGLHFHLNFRGYTREEIKRMAASMAKEKVIRPI